MKKFYAWFFLIMVSAVCQQSVTHAQDLNRSAQPVSANMPVPTSRPSRCRVQVQYPCGNSCSGLAPLRVECSDQRQGWMSLDDSSAPIRKYTVAAFHGTGAAVELSETFTTKNGVSSGNRILEKGFWSEPQVAAWMKKEKFSRERYRLRLVSVESDKPPVLYGDPRKQTRALVQLPAGERQCVYLGTGRAQVAEVQGNKFCSGRVLCSGNGTIFESEVSCALEKNRCPDAKACVADQGVRPTPKSYVFKMNGNERVYPRETSASASLRPRAGKSEMFQFKGNERVRGTEAK